jgi:hypothetical protein
MHDPKRGAVLGRLIVKEIGGEQPAGAGHALHDKARITRDVPLHILGKEMRIFRVATGNAGTDDDTDELALIERRSVLGMRGQRQRGRKQGARTQLSHPHTVLHRLPGGDPEPNLHQTHSRRHTLWRRRRPKTARALGLKTAEALRADEVIE